METVTYNTLEEIQLRRDQLSAEIDTQEEHIAMLWDNLFKKQEDLTRTEYITSVVSHGITAIDAFLLVRKLMKNYSSVFNFFHRNDKKRKKR